VKPLADPIEAFFDGIASAVGRTLLAFGAIAGGFAICLLSAGWERPAVPASGLITVLMLVLWGNYGVWFFLGLFSLIVMFVLMWAFVHDWNSKASFFGIFTAATIYYSPIVFSFSEQERRWLYAAGLWILAGLLYWPVPAAFRTAITRKSSPRDS